MRQYYGKLGLDPERDYTPEEVKKAWRGKCKEHHPDVGGDHDEFLAITHCYKMLTDPSYREEEKSKEKSEKADLNIRLQVPVTFENGFFGKRFTITFNRNTIKEDGKVVPVEEGEELDMVTLTLTVPMGTSQQHEFFIHGKGLKRADSDEVGDVFVMAMPQQHQRFKIREQNVITQEMIQLDTMLKGGDVEIQTMYGLKTLKVPPATQPGQELFVKNCGVGERGKHIVVVMPKYPTKEELKGDVAWKGLDINWKNHEEEEDPDKETLDDFERLRTKTGFTFQDETTSSSRGGFNPFGL